MDVPVSEFLLLQRLVGHHVLPVEFVVALLTLVLPADSSLLIRPKLLPLKKEKSQLAKVLW